MRVSLRRTTALMDIPQRRATKTDMCKLVQVLVVANVDLEGVEYDN